MLLEDFRRGLHTEFQAALDAVKRGDKPDTLPEPYLNELVAAFAHGTSERQVSISFNKGLHAFNIRDVDKDIACMVGEVSEVLDARASGIDHDTVLELADVVVYCYGIAQMLNADLDTAIKTKMDDFFQRTYKEDTYV